MSSSTTARFYSFLWSPFPVLHSRPLNPFLSVATRRSRLFLSQTSFSSSHRPSLTSSNHLLILPSSHSLLSVKRSSRQIHFYAQPQNYRDDNLAAPSYALPVSTGIDLLPWPEWSKFFDSIVFSGYFSELPEDLAWDELVGRQEFSDDFIRVAKACLAFADAHLDILWVLPRKDVEALVENVSPYIFKDGVDSYRRMRSYLAGSIDQSDKPSTVDLMRYLLSYINKILAPSGENNIEFVDLSVQKLLFGLVENQGKPLRSTLRQSTGSNRQTPGAVGNDIKMKRGDWVCPRCSFLNFAKNLECLDCNETRPKRLLTGGEWECPQCDFLNHGRNKVCLRCNCKNPDVANPVGGHSDHDHSSSWSNNNRLSGDEEKAQSWFTKLSHLESTSDANSKIGDENFPDISRLHEGIGKLGSDSQYRTKSRLDGFSRSDPSLNAKVTHHLDEIVRETVVGSGSSRGLTGNEVIQNVGIKRQSHTEEELYDEQDDRQRGQSERWLHDDVKDLSGATTDDDFLDTMPTRKGENRIVVSKKKDRSLTSPLYKRRTAIEQSGNNYVPFVPFPPGYFASDKQPAEEPSPSAVTPATRNSSFHKNQESSRNNLNTDYPRSGSFNSNQNQPPVNHQQASTVGWNSSGYGDRSTEDRTRMSAPLGPNNVNQMQNFASSQQNNPHDSSHGSGYPTEAANRSGSLAQSTQNQSIVEPLWKGRSLEGSAVKECDPLDMSEEAKAERFFKRVAQIKDIKELSEVPDEDFPSIMPLRKGVNRFVISKRKTPLERRLAQSQYRRNQPPVARNDSLKQGNE